jgi:hypothetical protein
MPWRVHGQQTVAGVEGRARKLGRLQKEGRKRILPSFGDVPLGDLDATTVRAWKAARIAEGLAPRTVNAYLSLPGTILNAAVDDDHPLRSPLL